MDVETIRRGRRELEDSLQGRPTDRVRLPGAGRPTVEKKSRTSPPSWRPSSRPRPAATR
jgi:hypothetical protein